MFFAVVVVDVAVVFISQWKPMAGSSRSARNMFFKIFFLFLFFLFKSFYSLPLAKFRKKSNCVGKYFLLPFLKISFALKV